MFLRLILFLAFTLSPLMTAYCSLGHKGTDKSELDSSSSKIKKNKRRYLIALDPGHGGFDMGATSNQVEEKKLTLHTAVLVRNHLSRMGYRVILTRSRDIFLPLEERTSIANRTKSHLLVSLHYNAFKSPHATGIEVYYYGKGSKWKCINSKRLAEAVLSRMLSHTGAASRGVKCGNFHIVRESNMPAILIEGGFITHPSEREKLKSERYLNHLARGIAEGVDAYFR